MFPPVQPETIQFAATRGEALEQLAAFVPFAGRYGRDRNKVVPGHRNVSRLSPAIRHGLIDPAECEAAVLARYAPSTVEKFVQELHWRQYWKGWLSLRPGVWDDYRTSLEAIRNDPDAPQLRERAVRCERGESPVAIMNHFARELTSTGYLHNHARMWFAGWWIHVERLPWQLGADFFFRNLLDADPASNTLSWRWVAGLQTPGKTYLPRKANIEKHVDPEILAEHTGGLELLARPQAFPPEHPMRPEISHPEIAADPVDSAAPLGIWIHDEDLRPEHGPLATLNPATIIIAGHHDERERRALPAPRQAWLRAALDDVASRAGAHFRTPVQHDRNSSLPEALRQWAAANKLKQVVALRPEVGPLADRLPALRQSLRATGARLRLLSRPGDLALRPLATGGFFGFWKKIQSAAK